MQFYPIKIDEVFFDNEIDLIVVLHMTTIIIKMYRGNKLWETYIC